MAKNGHNAKAIAHAKYSVLVKKNRLKHAKNSLGQKLKMPKTWEKPFYKNIRLVLWKKPVEKHRIFEKWDDFENQPSCRGYCFYKMVTFGHKFKMLNTGEEPFSKNIKVVLCKKRLEKAPNIWEMRRFLQSAILQML